MPQYSAPSMVEVLRSKCFYARARAMIVLPTFRPMDKDFSAVVRPLLGTVRRGLARKAAGADLAVSDSAAAAAGASKGAGKALGVSGVLAGVCVRRGARWRFHVMSVAFAFRNFLARYFNRRTHLVCMSCKPTMAQCSSASWPAKWWRAGNTSAACGRSRSAWRVMAGACDRAATGCRFGVGRAVDVTRAMLFHFRHSGCLRLPLYAPGFRTYDAYMVCMSGRSGCPTG